MNFCCPSTLDVDENIVKSNVTSTALPNNHSQNSSVIYNKPNKGTGNVVSNLPRCLSVVREKRVSPLSTTGVIITREGNKRWRQYLENRRLSLRRHEVVLQNRIVSLKKLCRSK